MRKPKPILINLLRAIPGVLDPRFKLFVLPQSPWSPGHPSPQRHLCGDLPSVEVALEGKCFKQRLGNFRETQYPDLAESGSPEELTDLFLGVQLASSHIQMPDDLLR